MKQKKMPVPLKILIITAACIKITAVLFVAYIGYSFIMPIEPEPGFERMEMHIIKTLPEYSDYDMWANGFTDFTIYGKYYFDKPISETELENSGYFKKVTDENLTDIKNAVADYEQAVESTKDCTVMGDDLSEVYDFDKSQLNSGGWWYYFEADIEGYKSFEPDETERYFSFNYYFYSEDAGIVYIMHQDI